MAEQWLTYQQAGDLLGMSAEAARQRARRLKWRTQRGNDGRALVLVPEVPGVRPRIPPAVQTPGQTPVQPPGQTGDDNALAALFREHLERAEAGAAAERARAERAEAALGAALVAAARAEGEATALRGEVRAVRDEAATRVQAAEAARDAARAELADWTAGGPLGRAWRALVYRRGRP
jgi:hypothetical protein